MLFRLNFGVTDLLPLHGISYKKLQVESYHTVSNAFISGNNDNKFIYDDVLIKNTIVFRSEKCTYLYVCLNEIDTQNKLNLSSIETM